MTIHENHPLQDLTTFATPAVAHRLVEVDADSADALLTSGFLDGDYLILGGGSNVVFTRDYPGTVIRLAPNSKFKIQN